MNSNLKRNRVWIQLRHYIISKCSKQNEKLNRKPIATKHWQQCTLSGVNEIKCGCILKSISFRSRFGAQKRDKPKWNRADREDRKQRKRTHTHMIQHCVAVEKVVCCLCWFHNSLKQEKQGTELHCIFHIFLKLWENNQMP